ncbi:EutN/CcmL family microcompartment protein [soil metagenome]
MIYDSRFTKMIIARILGTVVSTQKDERLHGKKLLIVKPINLDGTDQSGYVVAVDTVGAGFHEKVLVVAGSSARLAEGNKDCPVDSAIIGVIDSYEFDEKSK